ncbi:MAG: hypothetical protein ACTHMC_05240 [Pseudobacter sp.]|uniref:hypothetical protein n=1 Tax=Pseudobacter sp. TaxID=2045420 RepID=UPI003F7FBC5D
MPEIIKQLLNPDTAAQFKHTGNWNREIRIPNVWKGLPQNIPPHAVEALIQQGRKDFVRITDEDDPDEGKGKKPSLKGNKADKKNPEDQGETIS